MNMNLSHINTNCIEGRLLIATLSQLSREGEYTSQEPDTILNNMMKVVDHIYKDNPLPNPVLEEKPPFEKALEHLINRYSLENKSDTPDFILAKYLEGCLNSYNLAVKARDSWFGVNMWSKHDKMIPKKEENGI